MASPKRNANTLLTTLYCLCYVLETARSTSTAAKLRESHICFSYTYALLIFFFLAKGFEKCKRNDPNVNMCLQRILQMTVPHLVKGEFVYFSKYNNNINHVSWLVANKTRYFFFPDLITRYNKLISKL